MSKDSSSDKNSIRNIRKQTQWSNITNPTLKILIILLFVVIPHSALKTLPPLPILPLPSAFHLQWQVSSMAMFLHFGPNTFTDSEWGSGHEDPSVFNPTRLNASQWVHVAKKAGFSSVILTVKHHDGFCLWPSEYTEYSVKASPWRNGKGDVVGELAMAAKEAGIALGIYLSPWDRHEKCYGKKVEYNEFYMGQMTELLTRYGDINEVFLDGAPGQDLTNTLYYFDAWCSLIHQLQPGAIIFSYNGPDTRWIGNEAGFAGSTCWSLLNRTKAVELDSQYLLEGDPYGHDWVPGECDVSIRPGWFWHASELPKSALQLLDLYYKSAGRNCRLLLNVPPNSSGLISDEDIKTLQEFKQLRRSVFSNNLANTALLNASSIRGGRYNNNSQFNPYHVLEEGIYTYWAPEKYQSDWLLYLDLQESVSFNVLQIQEPIQLGQRIIQFHLEVLNKGKWKKVIDGTTVGYKRLLQFPTVQSQHLKFVIDKSRADPLISYLGIYMDKFSILSHAFNLSSSQAHVINGSQVLKQIIPRNHSQTTTVQFM